MSNDRTAEVHADNDRRQLRYWQEWEVTGREIRPVLVVATGIELHVREDSPAAREAAVVAMREAVRAALGREDIR